MKQFTNWSNTGCNRRDDFPVQDRVSDLQLFRYQSREILEPLHVISAAGNKPPLTPIEIGERPEAVMLHLVNPVGAIKDIPAANRDDRGDFRKNASA